VRRAVAKTISMVSPAHHIWSIRMIHTTCCVPRSKSGGM
jgi:hypothetical protein